MQIQHLIKHRACDKEVVLHSTSQPGHVQVLHRTLPHHISLSIPRYIYL